MQTDAATLQPDACYRAVKARDARFQVHGKFVLRPPSQAEVAAHVFFVIRR